MGNNAGRPPSPASRSRGTKFWLFVATGVVSALAGVFWTLRYASARADNGSGLELAVVAAVLLGGVSIFGGRGGLVGVLAAVLLLGVLRNALQLADVPANALTIVTGSLLILSVVGPTSSAPSRAACAPAARRRGRPPPPDPVTSKAPTIRQQGCPSMRAPRCSSAPCASPPAAAPPGRLVQRLRRRRRLGLGVGEPGGGDQGGPERRLPAQAGQQPVLHRRPTTAARPRSRSSRASTRRSGRPRPAPPRRSATSTRCPSSRPTSSSSRPTTRTRSAVR